MLRGADQPLHYDAVKNYDRLSVGGAAGAKSDGRGHLVSARESYLRAYSYYRAPLAFLSPIEHPERFRSQYAHARACFRRAASLFDPPIEPVDIPFEGTNLPAYLIAPRTDGTPRKTLIMAGGGDTFVEDLYAYIGPAATKRTGTP